MKRLVSLVVVLLVVSCTLTGACSSNVEDDTGPSMCGRKNAECVSAADCCSGACTEGHCGCLPRDTEVDHADCDLCCAGCSEIEFPRFQCMAVFQGGPCTTNADCYSRNCIDGTCGCGLLGTPANSCASFSAADCCPGLECGSDITACAMSGPGHFCERNEDCGTHHCEAGACACVNDKTPCTPDTSLADCSIVDNEPGINQYLDWQCAPNGICRLPFGCCREFAESCNSDEECCPTGGDNGRDATCCNGTCCNGECGAGYCCAFPLVKDCGNGCCVAQDHNCSECS